MICSVRISLDIVRTYDVVVFENETCQAGVTQLDNTSQEWFIAKYHSNIRSPFIMHAELNCVTYVLF